MGVITPKDPEKRRPSFYIMRNKEILGAPQPDGRGVTFLYMSDGRMISGAKIVGGIEDETMLNLLRTTQGFRTLVHSIGVTVEMGELDDIAFVLQMYGKTDPYVSGTTIRQMVRTDGMEYKIKCEDISWSDDDDVIGQIRFEMGQPGKMANVSVRLYLNDGYDAPEPVEEKKIDFSSADYRRMIQQSLMQEGNLVRLQKALMKVKRGDNSAIAYIGGSITQGAGAVPINTACYAYQSYLGICKMLNIEPHTNLQYVKAGVGGTPSELGMIRYERDVLRNGAITPDIVIIEFAVNDEGDETKGECFESFVRKVLALPNHPAVVLLFSVFADDFNLQERLRKVGERYQLPMISLRDCVVPQFYQKENRVITKNQYFYDCYHPSNAGHTIMSDGLLNLFERAFEKVTQAQKEKQGDWLGEDSMDLSEIAPYYGSEFEKVMLLDRMEDELAVSIRPGSFFEKDEELQAVEMNLDLTQTKQFPNNWKHTKGQEPFEMDLVCTALVLVSKDSASPNAGIAEVFVDGKKTLEVNPRIIGWTHCNSLICCRKEEKKLHHIEVRMKPGDEEKEFTILGFGVVR